MVLCDLPYGTTNCGWDVKVPLGPLWAQYNRILKPRGVVVLTAAQPFATDLINSQRKLFRYDLIWEKVAPVGFANANRMPLRSHEMILVFYKKLPTYHPQGLIEKEKPIINASKWKGGSVYGSFGVGSTRIYTNYPRSILRFPFRDKRQHPTQKPVELIEYLIRTYTNPGDLVMDNCMGSGTTAIACLNSGRRFVGFEKDPDYFEVARDRIEKHTYELSKLL